MDDEIEEKEKIKGSEKSSCVSQHESEALVEEGGGQRSQSQ